MKLTNDIPKLSELYKSMTKGEKSRFKKSFLKEFNKGNQAFDARRLKDFEDLTLAEQKWAANFLNITREQLFSETSNSLS